MNLGWISKKAPHKATETVCMSNNGKRVAWVTGGGSGIGESGAEHLAADGWIVVVSGRRKEELDRVVANITKKGGKVEAIALDVSKKADVNKAADQILSKHARIDLLVNSAGTDFSVCAATRSPTFTPRDTSTLAIWPARAIRSA